MPLVIPPLVDGADIVRLVGDASFRRGQAYARDNMVESFDWDPDSRRLTGVVLGSGPWPYHCRIDLAEASGGRSRPLSSSCSCPMDFDCKHVAATLLRSNLAHLRQLDEMAVPGPTLQAESTAVTGRITPAPAIPAWKAVVSALTGAAGASAGINSADPSGRGGTAVGRRAMGLQFELRELMPRSRDRWNGPTAKKASAPPSPAAEHRLGVRPVMQNERQTWVKANLTWTNVGHQLNRLNLNPAHHRWFSQFVPLHRASSEPVFLGQESDWLYLDDFQSPLLWHLLDEAARLGIPLLSTTKNGEVHVGELATVSLDATSTAPPEPGAPERDAPEPGAPERGAPEPGAPEPRAPGTAGLRLAASLEIDGHAHPPEFAGAIGDHGVYSVGSGPRPRVSLARTSGPLSPEQSRLLGGGSIVEVPAADVAEFLHEFYPQLRQSIPVTSSDASVEFPDIAPPTLVLTATFVQKPPHTLTLAWDWLYGHGTATNRMPLLPPPGESGYRDAPAEADLTALAARVLGADPQPTLTLTGMDAATFAETTLEVLGHLEGIQVDIEGVRPDYRELTGTPKLTITTVETEHRDWFDLGVMVTIDGYSIPFDHIFSALSKGHDTLLLVDGSHLSLDQPEFERLQQLIDEARALQEWETGLRISRYQASLWAEFEDLADETEQARGWRDAVAGLLKFAVGVEGPGTALAIAPTTPPPGVHATLRPYQQHGFDWLAFLWANGLGGILADDMGLGKTLQALALIAHAKEHAPAGAPFLVIAPTSVVSNWAVEAARFTPGLVVRAITATDAASPVPLAAHVAGADVIITSYALFRLDFAAYGAHPWSGLILDEAQFVKNPDSRAAQCARELDAPFKLAITGTPIENNLLELWSLFAIVAPGLFASRRKFVEKFQRPVEKGEVEPLARLRRRIRPLMLRRSKDLVAADLPAKQEQVLSIELDPGHRKIYEMFLQRERQKLLGLMDDIDKNRFTIFRSITLLRMLSLDASLVDDAYEGVPSSKLDALFEQLDDVVAENHRALIFSQFTSFLKKAAARLDAAGIPYCYLDGSTLRRQAVIDSFKGGTAPVFLISLKAGGFGLNLTEADYVFLLDPWWNPATETQAVDRTHRIGQTRNVMVYRLVAAGTIEEKVMALKQRKAQLSDSVLDDDGAEFGEALTADDIRGLVEE